MADEDDRTEAWIKEVRGLLNRRVLAAYRHRAAAARRLGITEAELTALAYLAQGPMTPAQLGDRLLLSSGGVTALVRRLERAGHAWRDAHPTDQRSVLVRAEPASVERAADCYAALSDDVDAATRALSERQRELVRAYLATIADASERNADDLLADADGEEPAEDDDATAIWA